MAERSIVVVDLNNFARYPTIAVGYLVAILRRAGMRVRVLSPLAHGVPGLPREPRATRLSHIDQQLRFATAFSGSSALTGIRRQAVRLRSGLFERRQHRVVEQLEAELSRGANGGRNGQGAQHDGRAAEGNGEVGKAGVDAVLISAYLMYHDLCCDLGRICEKHDVPLLLGGSYFFQREVAAEWRSIPGLRGLVCGEVEHQLPELVEAVIRREDLSRFPGLRQPDGRDAPAAPPLRDLDSIPFPDYSDFPWKAYPNAIVPIITGRGCAWGACTFCSDVTSTAGRSFRSRSPDNVLDEMEYQAARHHSRLFVFTDLKLNSNLEMWQALLDQVQKRIPGARWIAAVHLGSREPNGLSAEELRAARAAGMVRMTTGLESGSQRILEMMNKGTDLDLTSRCIHDARSAGISVRATMIVGYPGEMPEDVLASAKFLRHHNECIDRVSLNRFALITGTSFHRKMERQPPSDLTPLTINHRMAQIEHRYEPATRAPYRRAVAKLVSAVHSINREPLNDEAGAFEGVM